MDRRELGGAVLVALGVTVLVIVAGTWFEASTPLEIVAVATGAASVWLLANNRQLGWWVGIVSVVAYGVVFWRVALYAEVGIQTVYLVTSVQAIWLWLRGGPQGGERPVTRVPRALVRITIPAALVGLALLVWLLTVVDGAVPFWDALTTIMSLTAHLWLMGRYVESWWIWIAVDVIYVPLYASRGLHLTAGLYLVFLVLAIVGLRRFQREAAVARPPDDPDPRHGTIAEAAR